MVECFSFCRSISLLGEPCVTTCNQILFHVWCNLTSRTCQCLPDYPVNVDNKVCLRGRSLSEQLRLWSTVALTISRSYGRALWIQRRVQSLRLERRLLWPRVLPLLARYAMLGVCVKQCDSMAIPNNANKDSSHGVSNRYWLPKFNDGKLHNLRQSIQTISMVYQLNSTYSCYPIIHLWIPKVLSQKLHCFVKMYRKMFDTFEKNTF